MGDGIVFLDSLDEEQVSVYDKIDLLEKENALLKAKIEKLVEAGDEHFCFTTVGEFIKAHAIWSEAKGE
jgi:hypothetical protein